RPTPRIMTSPTPCPRTKARPRLPQTRPTPARIRPHDCEQAGQRPADRRIAGRCTAADHAAAARLAGTVSPGTVRDHGTVLGADATAALRHHLCLDMRHSARRAVWHTAVPARAGAGAGRVHHRQTARTAVDHPLLATAAIAVAGISC